MIKHSIKFLKGVKIFDRSLNNFQRSRLFYNNSFSWNCKYLFCNDTHLKKQNKEQLSFKNKVKQDAQNLKNNQTIEKSQKQLPLNKDNIPKQYLQISSEETTVGQQKIVAFHTKQTISILDQVKGARQSQSGQLYVLKFTCSKCQTKAIRSFTKKAYHQGVVLIRCQGCQNVHLVADNLGWFQDQPTNIETMGKKSGNQVKKVHDPIAITQFLKAAFDPPKSKHID